MCISIIISSSRAQSFICILLCANDVVLFHPFSIGAASTSGSNGQNLPIQRLYNLYAYGQNVGFFVVVLCYYVLFFLIFFCYTTTNKKIYLLLLFIIDDNVNEEQEPRARRKPSQK